MKHIKTLVLAVFVCSFLSFQTTESIVGIWELFKLQDTDGSVKETSGRWMEFQKDGALKGGNSLETTNRTGTWTYDEATKELSFGSKKKLSGEGTYTVNWIDAKTISLTVEKERKIFLRKMEKE